VTTRRQALGFPLLALVASFFIVLAVGGFTTAVPNPVTVTRQPVHLVISIAPDVGVAESTSPPPQAPGEGRQSEEGDAVSTGAQQSVTVCVEPDDGWTVGADGQAWASTGPPRRQRCVTVVPGSERAGALELTVTHS